MMRCVLLLLLLAVAVGEVTCNVTHNGTLATLRSSHMTLLLSLNLSFAIPPSLAWTPFPALQLHPSPVFRGVRAVCEGNNTLTVRAVDSSGTLHMDRSFTLHTGHAFVRSSARVHCSSSRVVAHAFEVATLNFVVSGGDYTAYSVIQWPRWALVADRVRDDRPRSNLFGSHASYSFPGNVSISWMAFASTAQLGDAISRRHVSGQVRDAPLRFALFGLEFNGKSNGTHFLDTSSGQAVVRVRADYEINHAIDPQHPFEWPAFFIGLWDGELDDASYATHMFHEDVISPPPPDDAYPWVQYDSWVFGPYINAANQAAMVPLAQKLGLEAFVLDLGWAADIGEWIPDPEKFPEGLAGLAKSLGSSIRLGLHFPIVQMATSAPVAQQHPEWLPYNRSEYFGATAVCLGNDPARAYSVSAILTALNASGARYIVQDGEDMVKTCLRDDHSHDPRDSNYANSVQGIDALWEAVRAARPDVLLENCEDGGSMLTFKMARTYHTSIASDSSSSFTTRAGGYFMSYVFSPRYSAKYLTEQPASLYDFRSLIFGGPLILELNLAGPNPPLLAQMVQEYRKYRHFISRERSMVLHLAPPDFPDSNQRTIDAVQALAVDRSRALVLAYRPANATQSSYVVRPLRLLPKLLYNVTIKADLIGGDQFLATGAQITASGIPVVLPTRNSCVLIEIGNFS